jgi:hypothetical protein
MNCKTLVVFLLASGICVGAEIPTVSADLGGCRAQFTVTDGTKPIYDAKVSTRIKYGSFGIRKLDLEVGTDANGQAMVTKLPNKTKDPVSFEISKDGVSRTVLMEPGKCQAEFKVDLRRPAQITPSNPQP